MNEPFEHDAIHTWFGLSYANYLVVPRTLLQSMPDEWQTRFVACLNELNEAFAHLKQAECYEVEAAIEREVSSLTREELAAIGYSRSGEPCPDGCEGGVLHETYYDKRGNEISSDAVVAWPVPDPIPHYRRGRTRIEPNLKPA